jgi:predicted RNase H-like HicB family nuclease
MRLQRTIKAVTRPGEEFGFVAECLEIPVVTQGDSLDSVTRNLQEAVSLHLEGEDLQELGFVPHPTILITFEIPGCSVALRWESPGQRPLGRGPLPTRGRPPGR